MHPALGSTDLIERRTMIYTLFFSRLRDEYTGEGRSVYMEDAMRVLEHARGNHPGFVDLKTYTAEDGERLTVARFESHDAQHAWRTDAAHVEAQKRGRAQYYVEYRIVVCEEVRERAWTRS
jgi:heme-degrading monooxygenase HmoA